jgi:hypothetical protein
VILRIDALTNLNQLRDFIGIVNYYRDMWPRRAHILAPLMKKMGALKNGIKQPKSVWTESMQAALEQMKAVMMAADVLCAYMSDQRSESLFLNID